MAKGGVDILVQEMVWQVLLGNPSTPIKRPTHGTTTKTHFMPSFGLDEAVDRVYKGLEGEQFARLLCYAGTHGEFVRLRRLMSQKPKATTEEVRYAFSLDLIANIAMEDQRVAAEIELRKEASRNYQASA